MSLLLDSDFDTLGTPSGCTSTPDWTVSTHSTIWLFSPVSEAAHDFASDYLADAMRTSFGDIVCGHRYARELLFDLVTNMRHEVELDGYLVDSVEEA